MRLYKTQYEWSIDREPNQLQIKHVSIYKCLAIWFGREIALLWRSLNASLEFGAIVLHRLL